MPEQAWYELPITLVSFLLATVVVNLFAIYKSWSELKNQKRLFIESQNVNEREDIVRRLNDFFGPMQELRTESRILYEIFALEEKEEAKKTGRRFRTIKFLTEGKQFKDQDKTILDEIVKIAGKQLDLIEREGWVVKNVHLAELLGKLAAHIRILSMAHECKLSGMTEELSHLVFPLEIDGALETEIRKLQDEYRRLMRGSDDEQKHARLEKEQQETIEFYSKNQLEYYRKTALIDLSETYKIFRSYIQNGVLILDAGCGVGRDTRYFIKRGYRVISFDASREMRDLCRQYPFAYCLKRSFNEITFFEEFDAVWACASLLHLNPEKFQDAVFRLFYAVKPGGILYFSLKTKPNERTLRSTLFEGREYFYGDEYSPSSSLKRRFYYYGRKDIEELIENELTVELLENWSNQGGTEKQPSEFTNYIFRRIRGTPRIK